MGNDINGSGYSDEKDHKSQNQKGQKIQQIPFGMKDLRGSKSTDNWLVVTLLFGC